VILGAVAVVDVTPCVGLPMAGYGARGDAVSTGVLDPLTASVLWLRDPVGVDVVWVAIDTLSVDTTTAGRVRNAVASAIDVDPGAVVVCASHTHAGPAGWTNAQYDDVPRSADEALIKELIARITCAAGDLRLEPVSLSWAVAPSIGVATNRGSLHGPHDDTAGTLVMSGPAGGPIALLVDYACHPTVLGADNLRYSADFPAAARRVAAGALAETAGGRSPAVLFLQGAAGDASTRFTRRSQTPAEAVRLGGRLGACVAAAAFAAGPLPADLRIGLRRADVRLPVRPPAPIADADADVERTHAQWVRLDAAVGTAAERIARTRHEGAVIAAARSRRQLPESVSLPITAVTLGPVGWAMLPVEPFASYGAAIRASRTSATTRVIGYADGYFGYLADEAAHAEGGYEARSSLFDPAAGDRLATAAIELLASVTGRPAVRSA